MGGDERAHTAPTLHESLEIELPIRVKDGVGIDRQGGDDLLHRRQLVARPQRNRDDPADRIKRESGENEKREIAQRQLHTTRKRRTRFRKNG